MVPSLPSTTRIFGLCAAASANARSIWSDPPHHVLQLATPALLRMSSISAPESESQPPLEVLIIVPTFSFDISRVPDFTSDVSQHCCALAGQQTRFLPPGRGNYTRRVDA